ncbi:MAG: hypothetical protein AB7W28_06575 [Armatimonadota bacterium]
MLKHSIAVAVLLIPLLAGTALAAETETALPDLIVPQMVGKQYVQSQLHLKLEEKVQLPCRVTGSDMVWQKLVGKQEQDQPPRYVRLWARPEADGGVQILGHRTIEFRDLGLELHWPQITQRQVQYAGTTVEVPQRAEGDREKWPLVAQVRRSSDYAIGCDLGSTGKFDKRRATWTAELHQWAYEPLAGLGDYSRPASHRFVAVYCVLDLMTTKGISPQGEPVELTPTCTLKEDTRQGIFNLYRVAALWQSRKRSYVHVPAYPGTAYFGPVIDKSQRSPHLFLWLFPETQYQVVIVYLFGLEDGFGPLKTSSLLRSQVIDYTSKQNIIEYLDASPFAHSVRHSESSGPVWHCGLVPNLTRIEPDGKITPLDQFASSLSLWVDGSPTDQLAPGTLDEAVSWDEELLWSGGARIAYLGIVTGEIAPDQIEWYQRWVQRVHELGYKAAVGWNCTEVFPNDFTYQKRPLLLMKTADGKDVPSPHLGFRGVMLNWLSDDWQKWAGETAKQLLTTIGFDYICLDWTPIDNVQDHYLLAPVDGTMADQKTRTSLSTGNPGEFSHIAAAFRGRILCFGDTEAQQFSNYTSAPMGHGFFSWNRAMTEGAGWTDQPYPTKAAAFERWCQMAALRMAYPGVPSLWADRGVTGAYCYLGQPGMRVLRTYADIVSRLEKESWGVCMDLPVMTTGGLGARARLFFTNGWGRGRFYLLVGADRDTTVTVPVPMLEGRYMVTDVLTMRIWSTEGPLQVEIDHKDNLFYPDGGLRPLVLQRLR